MFAPLALTVCADRLVLSRQAGSLQSFCGSIHQEISASATLSGSSKGQRIFPDCVCGDVTGSQGAPGHFRGRCQALPCRPQGAEDNLDPHWGQHGLLPASAACSSIGRHLLLFITTALLQNSSYLPGRTCMPLIVSTRSMSYSRVFVPRPVAFLQPICLISVGSSQMLCTTYLSSLENCHFCQMARAHHTVMMLKLRS